MPPLESLLVLSTASLAGLGLVGGFAAWAWAGWLRLRAREIDAQRNAVAADQLPAIGQRIDLADLKERIRKLEAIAAGVEI
jgi:hypothetical protein